MENTDDSFLTSVFASLVADVLLEFIHWIIESI